MPKPPPSARLSTKSELKKPSRSAFLPPRASATKPTPKSGVATYYLSCTVRSFKAYTAHAEKYAQRGFRGVLLGPVGLVFEPSEVLVGYQLGDSYTHALEWVMSNPLEEVARQTRKLVPPKTHQKLQQGFLDAISTVEGVELARQDAEKELDAAIAKLVEVQGTEALWIDGAYYDLAYSYEKLYLKRRRDPLGDDEDDDQEDEEPAPAAKKRDRAGKKKRRATVRG